MHNQRTDTGDDRGNNIPLCLGGRGSLDFIQTESLHLTSHQQGSDLQGAKMTSRDDKICKIWVKIKVNAWILIICMIVENVTDGHCLGPTDICRTELWHYLIYKFQNICNGLQKDRCVFMKRNFTLKDAYIIL